MFSIIVAFLDSKRSNKCFGFTMKICVPLFYYVLKKKKCKLDLVCESKVENSQVFLKPIKIICTVLVIDKIDIFVTQKHSRDHRLLYKMIDLSRYLH